MQQLEQWPLERFIEYASNPRKNDHAVAKVAAAIYEFGFRVPILARSSGLVIDGHLRLKAARQLGLATVPVMLADDLTDNQVRAFRLSVNKMAEIADWDEDLLALELSALRLDGFDLELTGFDGEELDRLLNGLDAPGPATEGDTEPQTDRAEELCDKWGVDAGQIWHLGDHRLLCGDSTKAEDVARLLDGDMPHLMVTDPPYGVEYDPEWRERKGICSPNSNAAKGNVINDDRADWRDAIALFHGDVAYVWHGMKTQYVVAESIISSGFEIRAEIVWAKSQLVISQGHYHPQHESCFYCVRNGKTGHWQGDRTQTTLWAIDKPHKNETGHSTQKPIECMAKPIENNSAKGDLIYEPFSGSGTTLIACENLGRKCRAIEIFPGYVAVALQRWADHTGQTPTLCPR